jgi:hypothetical protein
MPPEGIDSLNAESLKGLVLSLLAKIDELLARIAELEARIFPATHSTFPTNSSRSARISTSLDHRMCRPRSRLAEDVEALNDPSERGPSA